MMTSFGHFYSIWNSNSLSRSIIPPCFSSLCLRHCLLARGGAGLSSLNTDSQQQCNFSAEPTEEEMNQILEYILLESMTAHYS